MEQLRGGAGDDNPLAAWQRKLAAAREEMTALRYDRAIGHLSRERRTPAALE